MTTTWGLLRETRRAHLDHFIEYFRRVRTLHPQLRSALLLVSQYWNDEADDAVHGDVLFSVGDVPTWPSEQSDFGDGPAEETWFDFWMSWDDNNAAISGFAAYCHDRGSQEQGLIENGLPYALARVAADGSIDVEVVAEPHRPWLDLAPPPHADPPDPDAEVRRLIDRVRADPEDDGTRHVLADALHERGDPRGELISLQLHPEPTSEMRLRVDELLETHGEAWLGALAEAIPLGSAEFRRGFLARATAWVSDDDVMRRVGYHPGWATVESLTLPLGQGDFVPPTARALREVGPLGREGLERLLELELPQLRRLHLLPSGEEGPSDRAVAKLLAAPPWPRLQVVDLGNTDYARWLSLPRARDLSVAFTVSGPSGAPVGFRLTVGPGNARAEVEQLTLEGDWTLVKLAEQLANLPAGMRAIVLRPSFLFRPTDAEVAAVQRLVHCPVQVTARM